MKIRNLLSLLLLLLVTAPASAQGSKDYQARTTADPAVPVEKLNLLVKPMTKAELEVEAKAWLALLKNKAVALSAAEITARTGEGEAREKAADQVTSLTEEQTGLVARFNAVLKALEAKGGETEDYENYISAVTGWTSDDTKNVATMWNKVYAWLKSDDGGLKYAWNIGYFLGTLIIFKILAAIVARIVKQGVNRLKKTSELLREFFVSTTRKVIFFIGFIVALSFLGVEIGPFLAALGVVGFVIGFALQGTLSNFASGIMILIYRPYDVGDVVKVAGVAGTVNAMTLVSTTIRTFDNQNVMVPNNSIWGDVITNITGCDTRRVDMTFGIGYADDIPKAHSVLEEIVKEHPLTLENPAPVVKLHELGDSSVNFIVRPWCKTSDYWSVYWDVTRSVKERFDQQGISIPFPQQDVHIHQEKGVKAAAGA